MFQAVTYSNYLRPMNDIFSVQDLHFNYPHTKNILSALSFGISRGKTTAILGESGSGKSTLLRLLYGLEDATSGQILYENEGLTGPKFNLIPGHAAMKFVPQEFDLVDAIRVHENVGHYLSNFDAELKNKTIEDALEIVDLLPFAQKITQQLSGGQRQRVALARAMAAKPKVLLLDEPFSHLDQPLKLKLRKKIGQWAKSNDATVLLTTHDYQDALGYSDEIMVLKEGFLLQKSAAETVRNTPKNEYIASLFGEYNRLNAHQMQALFQIQIPENQWAIIYPEEIEIDAAGVPFNLIDVRYLGAIYLIEVERAGIRLQLYASEKPVGTSVSLKIKNFRSVSF